MLRQQGFAQKVPTRKATPSAFWDALHVGHDVRVIAELKRSSPSKGAINTGLDATARVREYVSGGAAAVSVLTEPTEFGGSNSDLIALAHAVQVPLLKKDFHVDEAQLVEAAELGASAVLLIARALAPGRMSVLAETARTLGLEPLMEVRSEPEMQQSLDAGGRVIGVNARDLETLVIDPDVVAHLLPMIPAHCVAIAESGITGVEDVRRVAMYGADAVLVGSALSLATDGSRAVSDLGGIRRTRRA